jgi:hypothetical protein
MFGANKTGGIMFGANKTGGIILGGFLKLYEINE